jgi:cell division protein FtsQ
MDGVGRFARSLTARLEGAAADALQHAHQTMVRRQRQAGSERADEHEFARPSALAFWLRRLSIRIANLHLPRFTGVAATIALFAATSGYGIQRGGHWPQVSGWLLAVGDNAANSVGLQAKAVRITGNRQLAHADILDLAGIGPETSVLFFDPDAARARLRANPWIAEATVRKLYPDQLEVSIVEREPFALWQRDGKIVVIAADGAVIVDGLDSRFQNMPLVVGRGADQRVREIVDLIADRPELSRVVRAAVLVAERRWNLVLKNGIDVRLPDTQVEAALASLLRLDAEKKLMSRDVTMIDLRVPGRVAVRLSDEAFRAHEATVRERQKARRRAGTDT